MKILITADWHIDKSLFGRSRLGEQTEALTQLGELVKKRGIDAVIIAGDVFDSRIPSSEAECLFTKCAVNLGVPVIAVAGNHDDDDRLAAPSGYAIACDVVLGGGVDYSAFRTQKVEGVYGGVRLKIGGETVNIALLPYPSEPRLLKYFGALPGSYADKVGEALKRVCSCFNQGECNILVSHLFLTGGEESSSERSLGSAMMLPASVIPPCDFAAIGHVHKPWKVSSSRNVYYPGSLLRYSFDERAEKSILIYDTASKNVESVPINYGRALVSGEAKTFEEAAALLDDHPNAYVKIEYKGSPLSRTQTDELKSKPSFCEMTIERKAAEKAKTSYRHLSDEDLFKAYYSSRYKTDPPEGILKKFLELVNE